jgi:hypothetical protein
MQHVKRAVNSDWVFNFETKWMRSSRVGGGGLDDI